MKKLTLAITASMAVLALFGRDTTVYDRVETRDGVTYAQRGGLANSNEVVTAVDAAGMFAAIADDPASTNAAFAQFDRALRTTGVGKLEGNVVKSVNKMTGDVTLDAEAVDALPLDWPDQESVGIGARHSVAESGVAIGGDSVATNLQALAIGKEAVAAQPHTTAIGPNAQALAQKSTAVGEGAVVSAGSTVSTVIGYGAQATAERTLAVGYDSKAQGIGSVAVGLGAEAKDISALAFGNVATAYGLYDMAFGLHAVASNGHAVAIGPYANALYNGAVAIGSGAVASNGAAVAIGSGIVRATAHGAVAIGYGDKYTPLQATAQGAVAIGMGSSATNVGSMAIGYQADSVGDNTMRIKYSGKEIYIGSVYPESLYDYIVANAPGIDEDEVGAIADSRIASTGLFLPTKFNYVDSKTKVTNTLAEIKTTVTPTSLSWGLNTIKQELTTTNTAKKIKYTMTYPDWATFNFAQLELGLTSTKFVAGYPIFISTNDMSGTSAGYETLDQRIARKAGGLTSDDVKSLIVKYGMSTNDVESIMDASIETKVVEKVNKYKDLEYDTALEVTWTRVVNDGHIYYIAVTNTNTSVAE
jgi:hypothetical protein